MHGIATKASILFKRASLWVLLVITTALLFSCKDDLLLTDTLDNIGHRAQINIDPGPFDYALLDVTDNNSAAEFTIKYSDREGGNLLQKIDFVSTFRSYDGTYSFDERHLKTVEASEFSNDSKSDSLITLLSIPRDTIANTFGLNSQDIKTGDILRLRWKMYLTTGDTLELECSPHWWSGFCAQPSIKAVHGLSANEFTGLYRFEQQETGPFGMWLFSKTFEAKLTADTSYILVGRTFKAKPYADDIGTLDSISVPIVLDQIVTLKRNNPGIQTGYHCGEDAEVLLGSGYPENMDSYTFNPDDDSEFTLLIRENRSLVCDTSSQVIRLTATKIQ